MSQNDLKREKANLAVRKARERKNQKLEHQKLELHLAEHENDRLTQKANNLNETKSFLVQQILNNYGLYNGRNFELLSCRISDCVKDTSRLEQTIFTTLSEFANQPNGGELDTPTTQGEFDNPTPVECSSTSLTYEDSSSYGNFFSWSTYVKTSVEAESNVNFYEVNPEPNSTFERNDFTLSNDQERAYTVDDLPLLDEVLTSNSNDHKDNEEYIALEKTKMIIRKIEENLKMSTRLDGNNWDDYASLTDDTFQAKDHNQRLLGLDKTTTNLDDIDLFMM